MDENAIPICYKLFSDNIADVKTLIGFIDEAKERYGFEKVVVVADKAINSTANIAQLKKRGYGWIFAQKIRGRIPAEIRDFALDDSDYKHIYSEDNTLISKYKSKILDGGIRNNTSEI